MSRSDLARAAECRKTAAACRQMAEGSKNPEDRERWFRIADKWVWRAVEAEHDASDSEGMGIDASAINRLLGQIRAAPRR